MPENLRSTSSIKARLRAAHGGIGIEHHHLVKERVDGRAQRGDQGQCFAVMAHLAQGGHLGRVRRGGIGQLPCFRRKLDALYGSQSKLLLFRLAKNVLDALECG